ncbi:MAG TPA: PaaI family thioesterase [Candidatus Dormibacteraeota bacterium]|nr:PaaI family thioesterase [Candidatus Dormibacteraeota bacterium]
MSGQPWERDGRRSGFAHAMGVRVVSGEAGEAVVECDVGPDHLNIGGSVHGGVVCTLVDVAVAVACHSLDAGGSRRAMATTELSVTFLQASSAGPLSCRARIRRRGRSLAVGEAEVTDASGRLLAVGRATYLVGGARPEPGGVEADDAMELRDS